MKKTFIYCIAGIFITYLLASFSLWNLNPSNWSEAVRFGVFFFGFLLGFAVKNLSEL